MLPKTALRHGLDRRLNTNTPVVLKAGEILKNAIAINELIPRNIETTNTFTLVGIAKNHKDVPYTVSFIVNRSTNEVMSIDVLYSLNTKTEPVGSLSPGAYANARYLTGSNISIADLLDYVNQYFPDILPESVLKHYGYESRPEGKIGESALFQDRDYSVEPEDYDDLFDDLFTDDGDLSFGEEADTRRTESIIEKMIEHDAESAAYFLSYSAGEIAQNTLNGLKDIELSDSS